MLVLLKNILPNNYPIDLIKLIKEYTCDCSENICNFCNISFASCHLKRCAGCHYRSCEKESCPIFEIKFTITYTYCHKEIQCAHSCPNCETSNIEYELDEIDY